MQGALSQGHVPPQSLTIVGGTQALSTPGPDHGILGALSDEHPQEREPGKKKPFLPSSESAPASPSSSERWRGVMGARQRWKKGGVRQRERNLS